MNEEEVKLKIVNDWLKDCGFSIDDLCFEKSFSIRFGKSVYKVNSVEMSETASPRLDVLVKNKDGKNLFIMELKADDINISKDDIDQGCSYAKQLDQIAPFTIITNGKTTKIFDSITKQEVTKKIQIGDFDYTPSIEEDLKFRYEALKDFIGLSTENLAIFSKVQIDAKMSNLKDDNVDSQKKYIPILFVQRDSLYDEFDAFLKSDSTCFSIVGESGTGKTNAVCDLAFRYTSITNNKILPFFYNCTELSKPIFDKISEDFNLNFSQQNTHENLIKRLSNLSDKQTVIFLDALDENIKDIFQLELNDFVNILKNHNIKICFTCKDTEYNRFLKNKGIPTSISENIFNNNSQINKNISFALNEFSDAEFEVIKNNYIKEYNLKEIPGELNSDLKNGFLLRIYAEIHQNQREFQAKNMIEIFQEYLNQRLEKIEQREIADKTLKQIGKAIWDKSLDKTYDFFNKEYAIHDKIEEDELHNNYLKLSCNETICPELFEYKILQKYNYDGDIFVGFYYTRLRDYIIGFQELKLDKKRDDEFENIVESLYSSNIGASMIQWYYKFAKDSHRNILDNCYIKTITDYAESYNFLIDKYFKTAKNTINRGKEVDNFTIAIEKNPVYPYHFFFPSETKEEKIRIFETHKELSNFFGERRGRILSGCELLKAKYPLAYACQRLREEIGRVMESTPWSYNPRPPARTPLCISKNPIILNELITKWVEKYAEAFDFCRRDEKLKGWDYSSTSTHILPLTINDILNHIEKLKVKYYLAEIQGKYDEKSININGMFCHVNPSINPLHFDNDKDAEEFIKSNKRIPDFRLEYLDELLIPLNEYKKFSDIVHPVLPEGDDKFIKKIPITDEGGNEIENVDFESYNYSDEQNKKYIEALLLKTYEAYVYMIEENFPEIKNYFGIYSNLSIRITYNIVYTHINNKNITDGIYPIYSYIIENVPNQENKVEIVYKKENFSKNDNTNSSLLVGHNELIEAHVYKILKKGFRNVFEKIIEENNIKSQMVNWRDFTRFT